MWVRCQCSSSLAVHVRQHHDIQNTSLPRLETQHGLTKVESWLLAVVAMSSAFVPTASHASCGRIFYSGNERTFTLSTPALIATDNKHVPHQTAGSCRSSLGESRDTYRKYSQKMDAVIVVVGSRVNDLHFNGPPRACARCFAVERANASHIEALYHCAVAVRVAR